MFEALGLHRRLRGVPARAGPAGRSPLRRHALDRDCGGGDRRRDRQQAAVLARGSAAHDRMAAHEPGAAHGRQDDRRRISRRNDRRRDSRSGAPARRRSTGDLFVVPLCVGTAIGRIGCFLSGLEDRTYGTPTSLPWGDRFRRRHRRAIRRSSTRSCFMAASSRASPCACRAASGCGTAIGSSCSCSRTWRFAWLSTR